MAIDATKKTGKKTIHVVNFIVSMALSIETLRPKKKSFNSGAAMYSMQINAKVPETITMDALGDQLEILSNELHAHISLD